MLNSQPRMAKNWNESQKPIWNEIDDLLDPKLYIGRSPEITERYAGPNGMVQKKLEKYQSYIISSETTVLAIWSKSFSFFPALSFLLLQCIFFQALIDIDGDYKNYNVSIPYPGVHYTYIKFT